MSTTRRMVRLGDVLTLQRGFDITKAQQSTGPYPVVSSGGISSYHSEYTCEAPGVVIGRKGSLGTVYFLKKPFWAHDTTLWVKDFKGNDPRFCAYLLKSMTLENYDVGSSNPTLNRNHLHLLDVILPPVEMQRRIANILSAYDDLIDVNTRRIAILEEIARRLFDEWFVNLRYPLKHQAGKAETIRLSLVVDFAKGKKPAETRKLPREGDVQLLLIDALRGGNAEYTSPSNIVVVDKRDTIMVMDGGSSCDVVNGFAGAIGSTLGRFRTTRSERLSAYALYRFLESKTDEFKSKNIGSAIPHANKDYIFGQMITLPPQRVNEKFDFLSEPIQTTIEILRATNQKLRTARDLLLPKLMSGEIDLTGGGPAAAQAAAE